MTANQRRTLRQRRRLEHAYQFPPPPALANRAPLPPFCLPPSREPSPDEPRWQEIAQDLIRRVGLRPTPGYLRGITSRIGKLEKQNVYAISAYRLVAELVAREQGLKLSAALSGPERFDKMLLWALDVPEVIAKAYAN